MVGDGGGGGGGLGWNGTGTGWDGWTELNLTCEDELIIEVRSHTHAHTRHTHS